MTNKQYNAIKEAIICILNLLQPMEFNNWENEKKIRIEYINSTKKLLETIK